MSVKATFATLATLRSAYSGIFLACRRFPSIKRSLAAPHAKAMLVFLLFLAGCATFNKPANVPVAVGSSPMGQFAPPDVGGDTAVALAFSGGGTRAAAFSFGVLRGLDHLPTRDGKSYLDRVIFVSGVSGGSVTAAYYGLKGRAALADFRERFLIRNAEEDLNTTVSLGNIARGLDGGVNDASRLPAWLDRNLFDNATLGDLFQPGKPLIWINASDLYNRTPFLFSPETFTALCSDIRKYPLSNAVAASAAVPVAFVPIVLESFPTACTTPLPPWVGRVIADRNSGAQVRAFAEALTHYREPGQMEYLKLADGGITDNFGLSGLVIARAAADKPYLPLTPEKAVRLRRVIFLVVNAGQAPAGDWSHTINGPSGADLLNAVTDTAVNSAVRSGFDAFRLSLHDWEDSIRKWRCSLSGAEARRLGASGDWRCSNFSFQIVQVGFDLFDPQRAAKLSSIPTRLKLPTDDVDLLIQSGSEAVLNHPAFKGL
jgi:NTE family protein